MTDTFFPNLDSPAPPLVRLRAEYAEALEAFEQADAHEDESGEPIPWVVKKRLEETRLKLRQEEAKQALLAGQ
jgi:hypothetical protein